VDGGWGRAGGNGKPCQISTQPHAGATHGLQRHVTNALTGEEGDPLDHEGHCGQPVQGQGPGHELDEEGGHAADGQLRMRKRQTPCSRVLESRGYVTHTAFSAPIVLPVTNDMLADAPSWSALGDACAGACDDG
jgi:hypothetical protein